MIPTERTPTCIETGIKYRIYFTELCTQPAAYYLLPESDKEKAPQVKQFYLTAFEQQIKLKGGKIIALKPQTFYSIKKGEIVTHRKIEGLHKKFVRI